MPLRGRPKQKIIQKYGAYFPGDADPLEIELTFINGLGHITDKRGTHGYGLPFHVKQAMKLLWPDMEWHRWADLIVETFLESPGRTACWGSASSGKSFVFSRCALVMFYARPHGTTVLISSTTLAALKRRIWDYVVSSHKDARKRYPSLPGSLIESATMLLAEDADAEGRSSKNGVIGVPCRIGTAFRGLSEYIGTKNEVMILVCDESSLMPIGFLESLANLESNDPCYAAIMGNLQDIYNPLAQAAEPRLGWESLPDTEKTRTFPTKWKNGRAIQLIGTDSPNLDYPEGQEPFKRLIGRRFLQQCEENYGKESDKYNMFASGKIPRASMNRTVFSKSLALRMHATDPVKWGHEPVKRGYAMDAAYSGVGGDRTAGAPFIFGKDYQGKWKLWFGPIRIYIGSTTKEQTHAEAIASQCKTECEIMGIPPEHMFYDGTGRSELTIAFARIWSSKVVPIEFGGPATERTGFTGEKHLDDRDGKRAGDRKTCREMYDRFVSELWFAWGHCIVSDQMRGLTEEVLDEGSQRKWEIMRGYKQSIETKDDMKERGLRSPDLGDCICVGVEGARRMGFPLGYDALPIQKKTITWIEALHEEQWKREAERQLEVA